MFQLISEVRDGRFVVNQQLLSKYADLLTGEKVLVTFEKFQPDKSAQARKYYHAGVVKPAAKQLGYDDEEMHEIFKLKFNKRMLVDRTTGEVFEVGGSTKPMKRGAFAEFVNSCIRWVSQAGVRIQSPEEYYNGIGFDEVNQTTI